MRRVMLFFGSFNPVHKGHMAVAEYVVAQDLCDELWFVVSPQNPFKQAGELMDERHRLEMVRLATAESLYGRQMRVCDIEFSLPRPSYTIDTLDVLRLKYRDVRFLILAGSDITMQIGNWKESERLLSDYRVYIYPRKGYDIYGPERFVVLENAPFEEFSSTEARKELLSGGTCCDTLPDSVCKYIKTNRLWTIL